MRTKVLVVEDDPPIRRLLVKMLEREGLHAEESGDGADALERILTGEFAVVVLDLMLPRISGYEILERCASALAPPRPVFVVITAFDASFGEPLDPMLVTAVVRKPFDIELLGELVRETAHAMSRAAGEIVSQPSARVQESGVIAQESAIARESDGSRGSHRSRSSPHRRSC